MFSTISKTKNKKHPPLEIGNIYGRLTVIDIFIKKSRTFTRCKCICGKERDIMATSLKGGLTKSCGCIKREAMIERNTTHGKSKLKEYKHWIGLKNRCLNENTIAYERYGKRGITVCKRWLNSFENFLSDMGQRPSPKHSVERKNNNKGYNPKNCVWATTKEQSENTSKTIRVEYKGQVKLMAYWAKDFGMPVRNLYARYHDGKRGDELFFKGNYPTHKIKKNVVTSTI